MNYIDLAVLGYLAWGFRRGMRRGLTRELYRLLNLAVAYLTGVGLYRLLHSALGGLAERVPQLSGVLGFIVVFGGVFAVIRALKTRITRMIEARVPEHHARAAAGFAGVARSAMGALALLTALSLLPFEGFQESVMQKSLSGRIAGWMVPDAPAETKATEPS